VIMYCKSKSLKASCRMRSDFDDADLEGGLPPRGGEGSRKSESVGVLGKKSFPA